MRKKLNNHEIARDECKALKRTWDNGIWIKIDDGKSPHIGK